jgi:hypothetical protein
MRHQTTGYDTLAIPDAKPRAELVFAHKKQVPGARLKEFRVEGKTISFTIDTSEAEHLRGPGYRGREENPRYGPPHLTQRCLFPDQERLQRDWACHADPYRRQNHRRQGGDGTLPRCRLSNPRPPTEHPRNGRVAVMELFVDAHNEFSAGAEAAFDALLKTYPPGDVVLLQYHESRGLSDPLSSPDGNERSNYYRRLFPGKIKNPPAAVINGKDPIESRDISGPVEDPSMRRHYQGLRERVSPWFDAETGLRLKLPATEKAGKIDIQATVDDLKNPGEDKRLRLVLVEESIHYAGGSSIRIHNRVVRSMPGGPAGFVLKEANSTQTATVGLAELKKQLAGYLEEVNKKRPFPASTPWINSFNARDGPLDLKNLKVGALVQDDKTGEMIQAAEVDPGAGKNDK